MEAAQLCKQFQTKQRVRANCEYEITN